MRNSLLLTVTALLIFAGHASAFTAQDIQKKYSTYKDFEAVFNQKTFQVLLNKEITFQGKIMFKKPGGVRMDVFKPQRQILILKDNKIVVIVPDQKVIAVQEVPKEIATQNFLAFMSGISNLEKDYNISREKDALVLKPKTGSGQIKIWADGNNIINRISLVDSMGNKSDVRLSDYRFNTGPSDELFKIPDAKEYKTVPPAK